MSEHSTYVLHSKPGTRSLRFVVHSCDPLSDRMMGVAHFAQHANKSLDSADVTAIAEGPQHPSFAEAIERNSFDWSKGCPREIVDRAVEMLIIAELFEARSDSDPFLKMIFTAAFSLEEDWADLHATAALAAINYLIEAEIIAEPIPADQQQRDAVTQTATSFSMALAVARSDYQRQLTSVEAQ